MKREIYYKKIVDQFRVHSICAILGPRQVGKTTLANQFAKDFTGGSVFKFDLEDPQDLAKFDNPTLLLSPLMKDENLIVVDEIQMRPDLFSVLRVLVDKYPAKLLILGSASRDLIRQSSETLAGRIGYIELAPFSIQEIQDIDNLWVRGGFPRSYLAKDIQESFIWRKQYIKTFLERDIPMLGFNLPADQVYRFWLMLCHYHGQTFNASDISRSLGISDHIARKYLDILTGTFMMRTLHPWFENIGKRQVKSPKVYFRDSGVLHALLGLVDKQQLMNHPRLGAFWEGFALEEIVRFYAVESNECFFWGTQAGAELDLILQLGGNRVGFEFKYSDAPRLTPSMRIAHKDLNLDHLYVIHPGSGSYPLSEFATVYGLERFIDCFKVSP